MSSSSSWVLLGDRADDLTIRDVGVLRTNLHVDLGLVDPPLLEFGHFCLPIRVRQHVANLLGVADPVDDGGIVWRHIPARSASPLEIIQVFLKLLLEGSGREILLMRPGQGGSAIDFQVSFRWEKR